MTYSAYAYHIQTVEYQIDKAKEYAANGSYAEAIACLEAAYEKDPSEAKLLFMEADYYYIQQDNASALQVLYRIIEGSGFPYEDVEEAYNKIITIYAIRSSTEGSANCCRTARRTASSICSRVIWLWSRSSAMWKEITRR